METKGIYAGEVVKYGWRTMKENLVFFIGLLIVAYLIMLLPFVFAQYIVEGLIIRLVLYLLYIVLSIVVSMGLIKIALKFCDNEKGSFGDLFSCFPLFFKYLFGAILYSLILIGGTILLIFPGVIWGIKFSLFGYFIVDKGLGPVEALKASSRTTMGAKWDLLGFWFVACVIIYIGILCLLIGIFAAAPTVMVATALVYRKLLPQTEAAQPPAEAAGVTQ